MQEAPDLETVSPAIFWREAARRLKLVDHEMPMSEIDVDEVFLGLRLQHELDFAAGKSAPILTRFLVLFDDELYRLLLAYAEYRLDEEEKRLVEQLARIIHDVWSSLLLSRFLAERFRGVLRACSLSLWLRPFGFLDGHIALVIKAVASRCAR